MHLNPRTPAALAGAVLALAAVVGAAPPAQAAPPEVNRDDCQAAEGTFDKDKGVKTCTTTATQKGNGDVTTTSGTPVLTGRDVHSQTCVILGIPGPVANCAEFYPTDL